MRKEKKGPLSECLKDLPTFADQFNKCAKDFYERIDREIRSIKADHLSTFKLVQEKLNKQQATLNETKRICECAEETLLNVLHAIRQNEYLQAYYPAQNGYPALKVTGTHPFNLDAK